MRTTIVLDDKIAKKIKKTISGRHLSKFINTCIEEHFEKSESLAYMQELEKAYAREASNHMDADDAATIEDWPEW